jgi:hypothetical protein
MKHKEVIEYYNNGQDEWNDLINIDVKNGIVEFGEWINKENGYKGIREEIDFYEWLFNPKYKVFEVFHFIITFMTKGYITFNHNPKKEVIIKNKPELILDYLKNQTKEVNNV